MIKNKLVTISSRLSEYVIDDFNPITNLSVNALFTKDGLKGLAVDKINVNTKSLGNINGIYLGLNRLYLTCGDGFLYAQIGESLVRVLDLNGKIPSVYFSVNFAKLYGDVFMTDKQAFLIDKDGWAKKLSIKTGNTAEIYSGMLFVGIDNKILVSNLLDLKSFSNNHVGDRYINLPKENGKIVKIIVMEDSLRIFCENAVYQLTASPINDDYALKTVAINPYGKPIETVCKCSDKYALVTICGKLYSYEKDIFSPVNSFLDGEKFSCVGEPRFDNGRYFLPVKKIDEQKNYIYYRNSESQCITLCDIPMVTCLGHIVYNGNIYKIGDGENLSEFLWESLPLDFLHLGKKAILGISSVCDCPIKMTIEGECSYQTLYLNKGYNAKKVNAEGNLYKIKLSGKGNPKIKSIKFKYKIKGE